MKRNNPRRTQALIVAAFAIIAVFFGALLVRKYEQSRLKPVHPPQVEEAGVLLVTLFFATPDGLSLAREAREIEDCADTGECAAAVVEELVNGPVGDLSPTLPPGSVIHAVTFHGETAVVDLGKEFVDGLSGGSHGEMMAVYSIVDSLAFNFPMVKKVQFLLNGEPVASAGHLDLTAPLLPDFTLEKNK